MVHAIEAIGYSMRYKVQCPNIPVYTQCPRNTIDREILVADSFSLGPYKDEKNKNVKNFIHRESFYAHLDCTTRLA